MTGPAPNMLSTEKANQLLTLATVIRQFATRVVSDNNDRQSGEKDGAAALNAKHRLTTHLAVIGLDRPYVLCGAVINGKCGIL